MNTSDWSWASKNGVTGGLLYEPGNWGDILKCSWAITISCWLVKNGVGAFRYADPFAGAPVYPLSEGSSRRLEPFANSALTSVLAPFLFEDLWPSTASVVLQATQGAENATYTVYDRDAARRSAWESSPQTIILPLQSGYDVLTCTMPGSEGLLLLDPYDLLADWREIMDSLLKAAESTSLLLYIYNRSARGAEHLRNYRDFRNALQDGLGAHPKLLGRIPADAFLPNAHHEMIWIPSTWAMSVYDYDKLEDSLCALTRRIDDVIRDAGRIER